MNKKSKNYYNYFKIKGILKNILIYQLTINKTENYLLLPLYHY